MDFCKICGYRKSHPRKLTKVKNHLYPKPNFIAEWYKFCIRNQFDHESVAEYVISLKKLSTHCQFGANLNDYLRNRLVSGICNETKVTVRERLILLSTKPVQSSDWGTPIVPVLKKDGSIQICGDFKITINSYLTMTVTQFLESKTY